MYSEILKFIAIISMLIDHIGAVICPELTILRIIGRIAFPIFAYQLAQGYIYSSNKKRYMLRIALFALISQIPYSVYFGTTALNIMVPLLLSLFVIDRINKNQWYWVIPLLAMTFVVDMSYAWYGVLFPIVYYIARNNVWQCFIFTTSLTIVYTTWSHAHLQYWAIIGIVIALFLPKLYIPLYLNKYFFYCFYPSHLIALIIINHLLK